MLNGFTKRTLKSALMAGAAVVTVSGLAPAFAQDDKVERVTVTGSRIPQKGLTSVSPVSTISNTEAKISGTTSAETLLNDMPQVFANQGAEVANGSSGTSTVDLRNLGPKRTLVLINGKRLHPANIAAPTADLNNIPIAMIDRVEILSGGASAVYGADAVAGVINFIYRKDFEGVEIGGFTQMYEHENDNRQLRDLQTATNFPVADKNVSDGAIHTLWGIMGAGMADGRGNVTAYLQYRHADALLQGQRDYSNCALGSNDAGPNPAGATAAARAGFVCLGSSNGPTGRFNVLGDATPIRFTANAAVPGTMRIFSGATDTFNFNPTNFLQRPDDRYLLGATAHYDLAPDLELYTDMSFMDDRTVAQIAASGYFAGSGPVGGRFAVNCDNPLLRGNNSASVGSTQATPFNALCGDQLSTPLGTTGTSTVDIGRRFVETNQGRQDDFKSTSYRLVGGLRGQLDDWDYDVYAQYGTTSTPRAYLNDASRTRAQNALLVTNHGPDGILGTPDDAPICAAVLSGADTSCVPANIFTFGSLNGAAIAYISATGIQQTTTEEHVVSGSMNGEIGIASPWATDNVAAAFGGEYRFNSLIHISDDVFTSGDLLGQGGSTPTTRGHYDVWEAFGEISIPLVQDAPFMKLLDLNGGYRISDYDNAGITHTYKYAGSWMPSDDIRFRASFQRAVRAPNVIELFTPTAQGLWGGTDPCSLTSSSSPGTNFYNAAQCANTGLNAAQFALFTSTAAFQCPAAQCSGPFAGNPNLKPESSDTKSFGFVFTPTFLKNFSMTVDYYDIFIEDVITIINQTAILGNCAQTGNPFACSLIHRDPVTGSIFNSTTLGVGIDSTTRNAGTQTAIGVDIEANYKFDFDDLGLGGMGSLAFSFIGAHMDEAVTSYGPGFPEFDCVGLYGLVCGNPTPDWKHRLRTTWGSPWGVDFSLAWRRIAAVKLDVNTSASDAFDYGANGPLGDLTSDTIPEQNYLDVAFDWNISDNFRLTGGINNVTDEDAPAVDSQSHGISSPPFGNGNSYPTIYDAFGREMFLSVTTRF